MSGASWLAADSRKLDKNLLDIGEIILELNSQLNILHRVSQTKPPGNKFISSGTSIQQSRLTVALPSTMNVIV